MQPTILGMPLGWVPAAAGPVWMALTVLMFMAAATVHEAGGPGAGYRVALVFALVALCWLHPFYSGWFERRWRGREAAFAGGMLTLPVALWVSAEAGAVSPEARAMLGAVVVWLALANVYMGLRLRRGTG